MTGKSGAFAPVAATMIEAIVILAGVFVLVRNGAGSIGRRLTLLGAPRLEHPTYRVRGDGGL